MTRAILVFGPEYFMPFVLYSVCGANKKANAGWNNDIGLYGNDIPKCEGQEGVFGAAEYIGSFINGCSTSCRR